MLAFMYGLVEIWFHPAKLPHAYTYRLPQRPYVRPALPGRELLRTATTSAARLPSFQLAAYGSARPTHLSS